MIFTTPPIPALQRPPKTTYNVMIIAAISAAIQNFMLKSVISSAEADKTCAMILMNIPSEQSTEPDISAFLPYSLRTISSNVVLPLRRNGTT